MCCVTNEILKEEEEVSLEENIGYHYHPFSWLSYAERKQKRIRKIPTLLLPSQIDISILSCFKIFLAITCSHNSQETHIHEAAFSHSSIEHHRYKEASNYDTRWNVYNVFFFSTLTQLIDSRNHSYSWTVTGIQVLSELNYIEFGSQIYSKTQKH